MPSEIQISSAGAIQGKELFNDIIQIFNCGNYWQLEFIILQEFLVIAEQTVKKQSYCPPDYHYRVHLIISPAVWVWLTKANQMFVDKWFVGNCL